MNCKRTARSCQHMLNSFVLSSACLCSRLCMAFGLAAGAQGMWAQAVSRLGPMDQPMASRSTQTVGPPQAGTPAQLAEASTTAAAAGPGGDPQLLGLLPGSPATAAAAPKDSDVLFSPRFDRPEAPSMAVAYGASRVEWSYVAGGPTLAALRAAVNGRFGAAINNNAATPGNAGAAIDFDGKPIVAPWMLSRGTLWNTCAAPEAMQALKEWIGKHLAAGATSIQFDDAGMQFESSFWGVGDFSPYGLRGFRAWVEAKNAAGVATPVTPAQAADYPGWLRQTYKVVDNTDYVKRNAQFSSTAAWRAYLRDSVLKCMTDLRSFVKDKGGGTTALSLNLYTPFPWAYNSFLQPFADYVVSEVAPDHSEFHELQFLSVWLRMAGQRWAPVFPLADKDLLRRAIATTYVVGGNPLVPWDVYIPAVAGNAQESRFFGNPTDFADLFRFVRRQAALLDGWETISRVNLIAYRDPANITDSLAQLKRLADLQVPYTAYLRASSPPGDRLRHEAGLHATFRIAASKAYPNDPPPLLSSQDDASLTAYSAASEVTPGLAVIVKANAAAPGTRVIHVVRKSTGNGAAKASMTLSPWTLGTATAYKARMLTPSGAVTALGTLTRRADGALTIAIPAPVEWAVVELTPV